MNMFIFYVNQSKISFHNALEIISVKIWIQLLFGLFSNLHEDKPQYNHISTLLCPYNTLKVREMKHISV
jgi:hypothetical protein